MSADEQLDSMYLGMAQRLQGGVPELLDTFFGFLQRKTDFFTGGEEGKAKEMVDRAFNKFHERAMEDLKKKRAAEETKKKKEEEARAKKEARVQEVTDEEAENIMKNEEEKKKTNQNKDAILKELEKKPEEKKTDEEEENEEDKNKLLPNKGNGSQTDVYVWTQVLSEVEVRIPVEEGTKSRNLIVEMKPKHLKVGLKGQTPLIDGELSKPIKVNDSYWTLEDGKLVVLHLSKKNDMEWWSHVLLSEPEINTRKVEPESSRLEDLDGETRSVVEKMRFDQMQKQRGLPTSDDLQKQDMLKKFMEQHPEMDFSQAKFS